MITLKDFFETVDYKITEGSDYGWSCFGSDAYTLTAWNGDHDGWGASVVFSCKDQTVYEVDIADYQRKRAYRLINPDYVEAVRAEARNRGIDNDEAWDDTKYTDLEIDSDWLDKACAIVHGQEYDTRVSVPVDFTDEELLRYMKMAHERDITFNSFIEEALREAIERYLPESKGVVSA